VSNESGLAKTESVRESLTRRLRDLTTSLQGSSLDQLIGANEQCRRNVEAK
jgi:hypothetical protein